MHPPRQQGVCTATARIHTLVPGIKMVTGDRQWRARLELVNRTVNREQAAMLFGLLFMRWGPADEPFAPQLSSLNPIGTLERIARIMTEADATDDEAPTLTEREELLSDEWVITITTRKCD